MHLKLLSQRSCSRSRRPHSLSSSVSGRPTQAQGICHQHHHQWLYSPLRTLEASHRMFRNLTKTRLDELPARRKGLYLHRTTQHRNTKTNTYAPSRIRTHSSSNQTAKTYALRPRGYWDRSGNLCVHLIVYFCWSQWSSVELKEVEKTVLFYIFEAGGVGGGQ
jgi:hypothetical protein